MHDVIRGFDLSKWAHYAGHLTSLRVPSEPDRPEGLSYVNILFGPWVFLRLDRKHKFMALAPLCLYVSMFLETQRC